MKYLTHLKNSFHIERKLCRYNFVFEFRTALNKLKSLILEGRKKPKVFSHSNLFINTAINFVVVSA